MKKETLLLLLVGVLVLLNLATLGYLTLRRPPRGPYGGPRQIDRLIVETLRLNPAQQRQFESLKREHRGQIRRLDEEYAQVSEQYFRLLDDPTTTGKASLETRLGRIQAQKAAVTFQHFSQLKGLCTEEQRPRFAALVPELLRFLLPEEKKLPPPEGKP